MTNIPEKYRHKALACEGFARNATDPATRDAWVEIAIEWHALAHRASDESQSVSKPNR
jgi:hypothetical protein